MRDMEIRGAGNLLGKEQSGNVVAVGFDLYTKILKEAVYHLKGEDISLEESVDPELKINVSAYIPDEYIPDVSERLVLYQRLAAIVSDDELRDINTEIRDRFGPPPAAVQNLAEVMHLRALLRRVGVARFEVNSQRLLMSFSPQARIDATRVLALTKKEPARYRFGKNLTLSIYDNFEAVKTIEGIYWIVEKTLASISPST
jgi:transcription-repair coupling factor (superfamily II helicase)